MITPTKVANLIATIIMVTIVFASATLVYLLKSPVDVIDDRTWVLTTDRDVYKPGNELNLNIKYHKLMQATGDAHYYLECKTPRGSLVRYDLSRTEGNRPSGQGDVDVLLQIPEKVPGLPTECRVAVSVTYMIYTFRPFPENNESNYFEVAE